MSMRNAIQASITKDTLIPIGLVCTIVGAGVTFGVMYNKIDNLDLTVSKQTDIIQELGKQSARQDATVTLMLKTLSDIKSDVNAIRDNQLRNYGTQRSGT